MKRLEFSFAVIAVTLIAFCQRDVKADCYVLGTGYCDPFSPNSPCSSFGCVDVGPADVCKKSHGPKGTIRTYAKAEEASPGEQGGDSHTKDYTSGTYCTVAETCTNYNEPCVEVSTCVGNGSFINYGAMTYDDKLQGSCP